MFASFLKNGIKTYANCKYGVRVDICCSSETQETSTDSENKDGGRQTGSKSNSACAALAALGMFTCSSVCR